MIKNLFRLLKQERKGKAYSAIIKFLNTFLFIHTTTPPLMSVHTAGVA